MIINNFITYCLIHVTVNISPFSIITLSHIFESFIDQKHHNHKKRKDSLEGSLDRILFATELEFSKILVPKLPQHTSNANIKCAESQNGQNNLLFIFDQPLGALIHLNFIILVLMFLIDDTWCKLCKTWLLLCKNKSKSITTLELNTGGKYYCSYYSRQGDWWQFEKANSNTNFVCL